MSRIMILDLDEHTKEQIERLARMIGKPEKTVIRDVVKAGLKNYQAAPKKGVKALQELTDWAEEHNVTGPKDLSTNHNKYAWEE